MDTYIPQASKSQWQRTEPPDWKPGAQFWIMFAVTILWILFIAVFKR